MLCRWKESTWAVTLTGSSQYINCKNPSYFPLTYPLLFPHGDTSGWHDGLLSTTGKKNALLQWVIQLLLTEPRFQRLGAVVNEFLIDVFSNIEDDRLTFHAMHQNKYTTSLHSVSVQQRSRTSRGRQGNSARRTIIPSSFSGGFADFSKKMTEAMAILRHFGGRRSYFITATCNQV